MFSIIISTRRDIEALKPLFKVSSPEAEIIIIDTNYNDKTKQQLQELKHEYYKVVYTSPMKMMKETNFKRDLVRCHNTGFAIAENDWIIKLDDCTELKPDFFDKVKEDIRKFSKSVIRPVKLESWSGDTKWEQYHLLKSVNRHERFFDLPRNGMGNGLFITLDQAVFPRSAIDALNGNDERFDIGHGWEDANLMQRFISYGYKIILDQQLMTFQTEHVKKLDPIPAISRLLYEITEMEVEGGGKYRAYNQYDIKKVREKLMPLKHIHEVKRPEETKRETPPLFCSYPFDAFLNPANKDKNMEKIRALKNKHKGEDLFILGNSPDITKEFIEKIRGKTTFASNGFIVCKDVWNYEPTYMVITNQGVFDNHLRNMKPEFKQYEGGSVSDLFLDAKCDFIYSDLVLKPALVTEYQMNIAQQHVNPPNRMKRRIEQLEKHVHIKVLNEQELKPPFMPTRYPTIDELSFDLEKGTYTSATVILDLMLPAAHYMGFKNIYLKGCSGGGGHFYDISPRHFWDEKHQKEIYGLYGIFMQKLQSIDLGTNIFNLDEPLEHSKADYLSFKASQEPNPTEKDGHHWDGAPFATRKVLGKDPWIVPYKNIEEVV